MSILDDIKKKIDSLNLDNKAKDIIREGREIHDQIVEHAHESSRKIVENATIKGKAIIYKAEQKAKALVIEVEREARRRYNKELAEKYQDIINVLNSGSLPLRIAAMILTIVKKPVIEKLEA